MAHDVDESASLSHKKRPSALSIPGVDKIIAVASGKGGVGKSTTAVNLALSFQSQGLKVGLLDADIYGPSLPTLLGVSPNLKPEMLDPKTMLPKVAYGLSCMSMGFLLSDRTPAVWRGPMASGALLQLLTQTSWQALDLLVIDMPPGTGDIHLSLTQKVALDAAIIVTTPQDIALSDAKKGIEMFRKVGVPVLGVVENMSVHHCSQCGHQEAIFGESGGGELALEFDIPLLGKLPLAKAVRAQSDQGEPIVVAQPQHPASLEYASIAQKCMELLSGPSFVEQGLAAFPEIRYTDE